MSPGAQTPPALEAGQARLAVAAGSVVGREHVRLGRPNQDGVAVHFEDDLMVAAVTDGCSSGRYSEVGARLGAAHLAAWVPELWRRQGGTAAAPADLAREAADALVAYLYSVASGLIPGGAPVPSTLSATPFSPSGVEGGPPTTHRNARGEHSSLTGGVADYLLFSFLCAVVDDERAFVFGLGDGVYSLNGDVTVLDPGPENAPDYLAYRLVGVRGRVLQPRVHLCVPRAQLRSLAIGTDGLADLVGRASEPLRDGTLQGGLDQFEQGELYLRNPSQLHKRLTVIGEVNRRLPDDTTLALIRGEGQGGAARPESPLSPYAASHGPCAAPLSPSGVEGGPSTSLRSARGERTDGGSSTPPYSVRSARTGSEP